MKHLKLKILILPLPLPDFLFCFDLTRGMGSSFVLETNMNISFETIYNDTCIPRGLAAVNPKAMTAVVTNLIAAVTGLRTQLNIF